MLVNIEILYPLPSRLKIYMFLSWWGKREEMKYKHKPRAKRAPSYYFFLIMESCKPTWLGNSRSVICGTPIRDIGYSVSVEIKTKTKCHTEPIKIQYMPSGGVWTKMSIQFNDNMQVFASFM